MAYLTRGTLHRIKKMRQPPLSGAGLAMSLTKSLAVVTPLPDNSPYGEDNSRTCGEPPVGSGADCNRIGGQAVSSHHRLDQKRTVEAWKSGINRAVSMNTDCRGASSV